VTVIPLGHPETGSGGSSPSADFGLLAVGALAVAGAGVTSVQAIRRRRHENGN
jgi:hypothetical protein